jgi:predicted Zn-dependent protease
VRLGAQLHAELQRDAALLGDRVVARYVDEIGRNVLRAAPDEGFEYRFFVVVSDEINAFAGPGGYVYVHTGTLLAARNASELAGVIAHEIGHVERRHISENVGRQRAAGIARQVGVVAAGVAAGPAAASAASLLGGAASLAALNSFGREAEREADEFAIEILPRAGYDPSGLVTFFETMQQAMRREGGAAPPAFLSSHPATEERIAEVSRRIGELPPEAGLRVDDGGRLEIIQRRIRLLTGAAEAAAGP